MALGWSNPYWACIAVAVVSLPTVGETFKKCLQRLLGTFVGGVVALAVIALFPQERWASIAGLALYLGICAFKITRSKAVYFWFLSGYVSLLIAAAIIGTTAERAFYTAVLRMQETGLGILVYALVSVFLWPQHSSRDLDATVKSLLAVQAKILHLSFSLLRGNGQEETVGSWLPLGDQLLGQLKRRLDASEMEQFEIRELRGYWQRLHGALQAMLSSMRLWHESFPELRHLDLERFVPDLTQVHEAMGGRFSRLQDSLEGGYLGEEPPLALHLEQQQLASLSHLERAAVLTTFAALQRVEADSRTLLACLRAIKEPPHKHKSVLPPESVAPECKRRVDADSLLALFRGMLSVWLGSLIWIFVDPPGHLAFVVFVGLFTLMGIMAPQMDWRKFLVVNLIGVVFAAFLYVFIMPGISRYAGLALLIFVFITAITYVSWRPRLAALRLAGVVPFIMMTNLQNQQTYDFASFVNNAAAMVAGILVTAAIFQVPISSKPEKMLLRVMARFFRQAEGYLTSVRGRPAAGAGKGPLEAQWAAMQLSVGKIGGWANSVDYAVLQAGAKNAVGALVGSLHSIAYCFRLLASVPPENRACLGGIEQDFQAWDGVLLNALRQWAYAVRDQEAETRLHETLSQAYAAIEQAIEPAFEAGSDQMDDQHAAALYGLLGGYRGVHRALIHHAALAADFDWARWRESRF